MMRGLNRRLLGIALAAVMATVALGLVPDSAHAVTTSWLNRQVKAIKATITKIKATNTAQWSHIDGLKAVNASQATAIRTVQGVNGTQSSDIASLRSRMAVVEGRVADLEGAGDFWPVTEIAVEPLVSAYTEQVEGDRDVLELSLDQIVFGPGFPPDGVRAGNGLHQVMKVEFEGTTDWLVGDQMWFMSWAPPAERPAAGTPIHVEYWVEAYGQRLHGEQTIADWTWES